MKFLPFYHNLPCILNSVCVVLGISLICLQCLIVRSVIGNQYAANNVTRRRRPHNDRHSGQPTVNGQRIVSSASRSGSSSLYRSDRPPTPFSAIAVPDVGGGGAPAADKRYHHQPRYGNDGHVYCDCVTSPRKDGIGHCETRSTVRSGYSFYT